MGVSAHHQTELGGGDAQAGLMRISKFPTHKCPRLKVIPKKVNLYRGCPALHPPLHFFDPGPNTETGRGGGCFYVGSIYNRLLVTFGLSPASLLFLAAFFSSFFFLKWKAEGEEGEKENG